MNMQIAGSGHIGPGEYEEISISGSGDAHGLVRCENFHVAGSAKGEEIECKNEFHVAGSCHISERIKANEIHIAGNLSCGQHGEEQKETAVKCTKLAVAGSADVKGDVEAECVEVHGRLNCSGLINAEEITIEYESKLSLGSVGGSKIAIYQSENFKKKKKVKPLFSFLRRSSSTEQTVAAVRVLGTIEGDSIALEGVSAKQVSGRIVAIGAECDIELVQYSEQVEIHPEAKVGRTERI